MKPIITVTRKRDPNFNVGRELAKVRNSDVLVGIPQDRSSRRGDKINNAELLYIHTHGSPIRNIPARPVLQPAISADGNRQPIARELSNAAAAWLQRRPYVALQYLKRAGIAASTASKRWFVDPRNNWAPNAPSTIRRKGSDRPLIDTGAMRKAITYVVRANG